MQTLIKMSRRYGSDDRFVLAGGGNTSVKDEKHLYVKGSGNITFDNIGRRVCENEPLKAWCGLEQYIFRRCGGA